MDNATYAFESSNVSAFDDQNASDAVGTTAQYEYDYSVYEYYYTDHIYQIFKFEVPVYGYIWPILVLFTTCFNLFVVFGFLRRRMRTATNIILISIAISDSLTGIVTLPATFHLYTRQNEALTKEWCDVAMTSRLFISRAFHTISVWQTLLLGIHRYLQLQYPLKAQRLCTMRKTLLSICVIYMLSFVLHIYHAFDIKAEHGICSWSLESPCGWSCVYIWCALLFGHLLPCFVLIFLAFKMVRSLPAIKLNHLQTEISEKKKSEKVRNMTILVIVIVVIFLIPELPYGIFYLTVVSLRHSDQMLFPLRTNRLIHCIYEVLLVLSFHLNFWVYCAFVRSFRSCVKGILRLVTCQPVSFERLEGETSTSSYNGHEMVGVHTEILQETEPTL